MTVGGIDATAPVSMRERKKRVTRDALHRAAVRLVASRGLASVTVEEIAAAADFSPRTFFNHFASKEDAVAGWDPDFAAGLCGRLLDRPPHESPPLALRQALVAALSEFDADHRDLLERLRVTRSDPHLLANQVRHWGDIERELVGALAQRRGTDSAHDHYAALVVATILSAGRSALMSWCAEEGVIPLAKLLDWHLDILAAGLAAPEWEMP